MKVKKDKFLTQYMGESQDAPILETASRKNYGSGSKGTTATSASYTISSGSKVGGRIGNASRRGFMRARGTSVQKGTEASKKDPVASKLSHLLTKSKKVKHSYAVPHTADAAPELADAYDDVIAERAGAREKRGAFGIIDWLTTPRVDPATRRIIEGGLGRDVKNYLDLVRKTELEQYGVRKGAKEAYLQSGKYSTASSPWKNLQKYQPAVLASISSAVAKRAITPQQGEIFKSLLVKQIPTTNNLWTTLENIYTREGTAQPGAQPLRELIARPDVQPYKEIWENEPHTRVWDANRQKQQKAALWRGQALEAAREQRVRTPGEIRREELKELGTQLQKESRSKRRPGATTRAEIEEEPPDETDAEMSYDLPGGSVTETERNEARMEGIPVDLINNHGTIEGRRLWSEVKKAMRSPQTQQRIAEQLAVDDRQGKMTNRNAIAFVTALEEFPELNQKLYPDERNAVVEHIDSLHNEMNADLVRNPEEYLFAYSKLPTNLRRYLKLVRTGVTDFDSGMKLGAYIDKLRGLEQRFYDLNQRAYISKYYGKSPKSREALTEEMNNILAESHQIAKQVFSNPETVNIINNAYTKGGLMEKYSHPAVSEKETPVPDLAALKQTFSEPLSPIVSLEEPKSMRESARDFYASVKPYISSGKPIPPELLEEGKGLPQANELISFLENKQKLKQLSNNLKETRAALKTGKIKDNITGTYVPIPPEIRGQMAQKYEKLQRAYDTLYSNTPEAKLKQYYADPNLHITPQERARYVSEIMPSSALTDEESKLLPEISLRSRGSKRALEQSNLERQRKRDVAHENFQAHLNNVKELPGTSYHSSLLNQDYNVRFPLLLDSMVDGLVEDAKDQLVEQGRIAPQERNNLVYNPRSGHLDLIQPNASQDVTMEDMPALITARTIQKHKEDSPSEIEDAYYDLKKYRNDPTVASDTLQQMKTLEFMRMFYGPLVNPEDLQKDPATGAIAGAAKPRMMQDPLHPELDNVFTKDDLAAITANYQNSFNLLGYNVGKAKMLASYQQLPGAGKNATKAYMENAAPFYSQWWMFNKDIPQEMKPSPSSAKEFNALTRLSKAKMANQKTSMYRGARGVQTPTEELAQKRIGKEVRTYEPPEKPAQLPDIFKAPFVTGITPPSPEEERETIEDVAHFKQDAPQSTSFYEWMKENPSVGGFLNSIRQRAQSPEQPVVRPPPQPKQTTLQPASAFAPAVPSRRPKSSAFERPEPMQIEQGRYPNLATGQPKLVNLQTPVPELDRGPKLGEIGKNNVPKASPKPQEGQTSLVEAQDLLDKFTGSSKEFGDYNIGGRLPSGKTTTGEERYKRVSKFYGQEGQGQGLKARTGNTAHVDTLDHFMRKGAKRQVEKAKPLTIMREGMKENLVPGINEKNNQPPDTALRSKPGSFAGQKPGSIVDRFNIMPKKTQNDGNALPNE